MAEVARNTTVPGLLLGVGVLAVAGAAVAQGVGVVAWPLIVGLVGGAFVCAAVIAHSPRTGTFVTALAAAAANAYLFTRKLEASAGDAAGRSRRRARAKDALIAGSAPGSAAKVKFGTGSEVHNSRKGSRATRR